MLIERPYKECFIINIGDLNMKEKEFDPNVIDDSEFERLDKSLDKKDNRNR